MSKKQSNLGKNPNLKWLLIVIALIILLAIPGYSWMKEGNRMRAQRQKSILSPVIMVPGSSATTERFNELVNQLNRDTPTKHSVLKINVSTKGVLSYSGSIDKNDNEPFIIVGFQNNKDGYSNIKKQAGWLDQAFYDLTQNYRFNNFKAFGHSNGGLIWTYWLEHYYSTYSDEITMKRLMTQVRHIILVKAMLVIERRCWKTLSKIGIGFRKIWLSIHYLVVRTMNQMELCLRPV